MKKIYSLSVDNIHPVPQGSPNAVYRGGHIVFYNPKNLDEYRKKLIRYIQNEYHSNEYSDRLFHIDMEFRVKRPALPGDVDKLARAILDVGTQSGIYTDDCQVISITAKKIKSSIEGVTVIFSVYEDDEVD